MAEITDEQLQLACCEWQKRLRLQDWIVKARFETWHAMGDRPGAIQYNLQHKTANLRVMQTGHYCDHWDQEDQDWESHLIHELLHLHFAPFWVMEEDNRMAFEAQEQAINLITQGLLDAKRGNKKCGPDDYRERLEA